jgi:hypothetical protein
MGFDLYGMKPENKDNIPKPDFIYNDEDSMKAYFVWQRNTKGAYFRNNVWYWRPLWAFICDSCSNVLTLKDMKEGCMNNSHIISKTKSKRIASRLRTIIKKWEISPDPDISKYGNKDYPFCEDNVKAFEKFCEKSGGFEIC